MNRFSNIPIQTETGYFGQSSYYVAVDFGYEVRELLRDAQRQIADSRLDDVLRRQEQRRRDIDEMIRDFRAFTRRFMRGETSRPPPCETKLRTLPIVHRDLKPQMHETRVSSRLLAAARGRRPRRGRPGRPHDRVEL